MGQRNIHAPIQVVCARCSISSFQQVEFNGGYVKLHIWKLIIQIEFCYSFRKFDAYKRFTIVAIILYNVINESNLMDSNLTKLQQHRHHDAFRWSGRNRWKLNWMGYIRCSRKLPNETIIPVSYHPERDSPSILYIRFSHRQRIK